MLLKLFLCFVQIGLLSIGGGYAAVPIIQNRVVDTFGWITSTQFADLITIAEMTPGPIAVNCATFTGMQIAGIKGAIAATAGCVFPSCIIVILLILIYYKFRDGKVLKTVLQTLRPVVVALIISAGFSIAKTCVFTEEGIDMIAILLVIASFFIIRKTKIGAIPTMIGCGVIYTLSGLLF